MTKDEIIRMAREAGFTVGFGSPALPKHERFADLVLEEAAKVCEKLLDEAGYPAWNTECADAIRALKEKNA